MIRKTDPQMVVPYLRDASGFSGGSASEVVIPETREELSAFLRSNRQPITIAGAGTGVTASRIPSVGVVVSLERFKGLGEIENSSILVGATVTLGELHERLRGTSFFYPPNPTETNASIGGTIGGAITGALCECKAFI